MPERVRTYSPEAHSGSEGSSRGGEEEESIINEALERGILTMELSARYMRYGGSWEKTRYNSLHLWAA